MYCSNCGAQVNEGTKFCPNCGAQMELASKPVNQQATYTPPQQSSPYQQPAYVPPQGAYISRKTPIVGVILSWFVLTGSGQMYAGKVGRGFAFLGSVFVLGLVIGIVPVLTYNFVIMWVMIPILLGFQIWNIVDAYKQCENYNRFIDQHGRAPTSNDNW